MTKLTLEIFDDVISVLNKIGNLNDTGVELEVPEGSVLFENILNLKLIHKHAEKYGLTVHFTTRDEIGNVLIDSMEDGISTMSETDTNEGFAMENISVPNSRTHRKIRLPKLALPDLGKRLFKIGGILIIVGLALFFILRSNSSKQTATAKIIVNSQPLARSVTIKVKADTDSDAAQKILMGTIIKTSVEKSKEIDVTGEKQIGEKAEGKATIYNKTTEERDFDDGTILTFDRDEGDLNFLTKDDVTVPAAAPEDPNDPGSPLTPGSIEVEIEAEKIGAEYNIEKNKTLEVKGQKKADFEGKVLEATEGGKSETVKVVAEVDKQKLSEELTKEITEQSTSALKTKVANSQQLVEGSHKVTLISEKFDHDVGDDTEKLSLSKSTEVEGLVYMKSNLDKLLDELLKEFVPEGYELSDKEREVNVEVLGNSSNSVLSSTEADIQVTLKTFVVPAINEEEIKQNLLGKSPEEAQKILGGISNIKTYEFNMSNGFLPFNRKVPKNPEQVEIIVERE
ncbi:hypothetical protein C4561_03855 [candidate division WWE3 bacterium]|jgi:hypothetical protein|uniref:Baseplate protein J-like domain-containing protein n=1 Tax=candidate division WWE3 bacterium TaxID=2053526 RepID=A0A3A4ZCA1_UNCKA|nr:MAG: hypothetical protein C4561_03855 [candidate division WWE3 bacterium]